MSIMHLKKQSAALSEAMDALPLIKTLTLMGHAVFMGMVLMMISIWATSKLNQSNPKADKSGVTGLNISETVLGASNYLFLTMGMTVVMILVNNNLARAFAIGAAISLVRLRIKVDGKGQGTTLLMAVLMGMACGVDQVPMAWGLLLIYSTLQVFIVSYVSVWTKKQPQKLAVVNKDISSGLVSLKSDVLNHP
jgi:hypothetical protein